MAQDKLTKNQQIRELYRFIIDIKNSNEDEARLIVSDFMCFLDDNDSLKQIYDKNVAKYKELRNNSEFQARCKNLVSTMKKIIKDNLEWEPYEEYLMPKYNKSDYDYTSLYFWNTECFFNELTKPEKTFVQNSTLPLYLRNTFIFNRYCANNTKQKNAKNDENFEKFREAADQIFKFGDDPIIYDFYFLDFENNMPRIEQITQIKTATVNVAEELIRFLKLEKSNNITNEQEYIVKKKKEITDKEIEVYKLAQKGYSRKEIARELGVAETTIQTHIENIGEKTNCKGLKALRKAKSGI